MPWVNFYIAMLIQVPEQSIAKKQNTKIPNRLEVKAKSPVPHYALDQLLSCDVDTYPCIPLLKTISKFIHQFHLEAKFHGS